MNACQLKLDPSIRPLKLPIQEISHLVIEPTQRCNLNCRTCYNRERGYTKSLAEVKSEIDLGLRKRRLETISLLGGEPTLHPDLPEIISYIKSRNLVCQILTNGLRFLDDPQDPLFDRVIRAGIDRIVFHVDEGQSRVHPDLDAVCSQLFARAEKRRVYFGIAVTISRHNQGCISAIMKRYAHYHFFDGILATLARDTEESTLPGARPEPWAQMISEYAAISNELRVEPATYLPSSLDDRDICWLIYFYYINSRTGRTFGLSPWINRLFRRAYRLTTGRQMFAPIPNPARFREWFFASTALDCARDPAKLKDLRALLQDSERAAALRLQYIVIQQPPEFNSERGKIQMCYHCPDATIRKGKLTPVCVADQIGPLSPDREVNRELFETVYRHLEQI